MRAPIGQWVIQVEAKASGFFLTIYRHLSGKLLFAVRQRRFATHEQATQWAAQHGYTEEVYIRRWCRVHRTIHFWMGYPQVHTSEFCYTAEDKEDPKIWLRQQGRKVG